jgi:hypothetical protein
MGDENVQQTVNGGVRLASDTKREWPNNVDVISRAHGQGSRYS